MRRFVTLGLVAGAAMTLSGCAQAPVIVVPTHAQVAQIEGDWVSTRTLTSTTIANDDIKVGDQIVRDVTISRVVCDADGSCTGSVTSNAPDGTTNPTTSTLTFGDDTLKFAFPPEPSDCTYTDGTVVSADAFSLVIDYTFTVSKGDDETVTELTGTSSNTVTTTDAAIALGCPAGGHREFDVVLARAS